MKKRLILVIFILVLLSSLVYAFSLDDFFEKIKSEVRLVEEECDDECPVSDECHECGGRVTNLTLKYLGNKSALITVVQKEGEVVFNETVNPDDQFSFFGVDKKNTLSPWIDIFIDNVTTRIHTSCSEPIGPGLVIGNFLVISGRSKIGGNLCPVDRIEINSIECKRDEFIGCPDLRYGDILNGVRVNCTGDDINNVSFSLFNLEDNNTLVSGSTNFSDDYWFINSSLLINDSGIFNLSVNCSSINLSDSENIEWGIPFGYLNVDLINPVKDINVSKGSFFEFRSKVSCFSGECGDISASLDPKLKRGAFFGIFNFIFKDNLVSGMTAGDLVSVYNGDVPFYTVHSNPILKSDISCLAKMGNNNSCITYWNVNASGSEGVIGEFYSIYSSEYSDVSDKESDRVNVKIVSEGEFVSIDVVDSGSSEGSSGGSSSGSSSDSSESIVRELAMGEISRASEGTPIGDVDVEELKKELVSIFFDRYTFVADGLIVLIVIAVLMVIEWKIEDRDRMLKKRYLKWRKKKFNK